MSETADDDGGNAARDNRSGRAGATAWLPDLLYTGGRFLRGAALVCDAHGNVLSVMPAAETERGLAGEPALEVVRLRGRAVLPGLVNAHSHAFQRVIRGRTEYRSAAHERDSFWTWREMMYSASARLSPEDIYDASRMAFLEMLLGGITAVGEFHYIHRTPQGTEYDDPNLLSKQVVRAARDTGLRIALLSVAYARSGFRTAPDERQKRFIEPDAERFLRRVEELQSRLAAESATGNAQDAVESAAGTVDDMKGAVDNIEGVIDDTQDGARCAAAWTGVAPHSVRAVPLEYIREVNAYAVRHKIPLHMHVAEQPAEVAACLEETRRRPVELLADEGLLGPHFTGVHAVHIEPGEVAALGAARAVVCACPTTERNLGDGVVPAGALFDANVPVALGTDSHTQIDLLEDARELEYHLRLLGIERNVLARVAHEGDDAQHNEHAGWTERVKAVETGDAKNSLLVQESNMSSLASSLFACATVQGARSIGARGGELSAGRPADFFTVDLHDPSVAGATEEDLLPAILFSLSRTAIRETIVGGRIVVELGRHGEQEEIVRRFAALQRKLWGEPR